MRITVIVPTYRRPDCLLRCLDALGKQTLPPDEVIVTVREDDEETLAALSRFIVPAALPLLTLLLNRPGQVYALNQAISQARGQIIAITDDDAEPHADWLERILAHFQADPSCGGVGGRDILYEGGKPMERITPAVGRIQWFGRLQGYQSFATGPAREVELLKGVNMSFRRTALKGVKLDDRLLGTGAQVFNDTALCLTLLKRGWRLIFDPAVAVDHFPAPRFDEDQREGFSAVARMNSAHNETLTLLEYFPAWRQFVFLFWAVLIGTRADPGLVQASRAFLKQGPFAYQRMAATLRGRWMGWCTYRRSRGIKPREGSSG